MLQQLSGGLEIWVDLQTTLRFLPELKSLRMMELSIIMESLLLLSIPDVWILIKI
jgi:hypothetical protein